MVKQASDLLPQFALYQDASPISHYDYQGTNEDKFNALHYTRIVAQLAGIIYYRSGHFHVKKAAQKQFQAQGVSAFFLPMLESAIREYNWGYLDAWEDEIDLRQFWLFMLWRIQHHSSFEQLISEIETAFPALLDQLPISLLNPIIETRFIQRFLQYWGFVTFKPSSIFAKEPEPTLLQIQPLLRQTFKFSIE